MRRILYGFVSTYLSPAVLFLFKADTNIYKNSEHSIVRVIFINFIYDQSSLLTSVVL